MHKKKQVSAVSAGLAKMEVYITTLGSIKQPGLSQLKNIPRLQHGN